MNMHHYIWLLVLLAGSFGCGTGEKELPQLGTGAAVDLVDSALAARPEAPVRMAFDRFTTDDGLCSNDISCIFQDSRGFLWLGTDAGLNRYDGYTFKKYQHEANNPSSLLENNVMSIAEDSKGRIWVLSANGLSELDPYSGKIHTYTDSLTTGRINTNSPQMVLDRYNMLWIDGNKGLTFDISKKRFNVPTTPFKDMSLDFKYTVNGNKEIFCITVVKVAEDDDPDLQRSVVMKQRSGDPLQLDLVCDTIAPNMRFGFSGNVLCMNGDRYLRVGDQDGFLKEYDLQTNEFREMQPRTGTIKGMALSPNDRVLWVAGWVGLGRYDLNRPPAFAERIYFNNDREPLGLPARTVVSVLEDRNGNIWAGVMGAGLCRYSPSKNKAEQYRYAFPDTAGLPGRSVEALCFDKHDRLWVGTDKGLCRLDDRRRAIFRTFRQPRPARPVSNYDAVRAICEDPGTDRLYMGYWGVPLDYFDMKKERYFPLEISNTLGNTGKHWLQTYNAFVRSVRRSSDGNIYYTDFGHALHQYEPRSKRLINYCAGDAENRQHLYQQGLSLLSTALWLEKPNQIWLGNAENRGIVQLDLTRGEVFGQRIGNTELESDCTTPLIGTFTSFRPEENAAGKLQSGSANCFFEDRQKRLWIGTEAGLHLVKAREQGVFECFAAEAGFPNANIQAILEDDHGRLWVSTYDGICCFDPETKRVTAHYDADDGLQGSQFSQNSAAKNSQGLMAFGGPNGFNLFHPDSIFQNVQTPTVALAHFEVNGIPAPIPQQGVELAHSDKNLTFEPAVMDFSNPKRNRYQYYLEGYDTGWCAPTPVRQVRYTNLAPGKYTFRVRGCNADGIWSRNDLVFPVTILAPWWATWWFRALLVLAALGVVALLVRRREARLRRKLEEDERTIRYLQVQTLQAQMNPHFIFNVLGVMQHQIIKSKPQEANRQLGNLSTLIRRFLDSSVSSAPMVKGLSQNDIPLEEEIELLTMYAEFEVLQRQEKFEGKGFSIEVDDSVHVSNMRIPPMIIQPYIENAVKHGIRYLPEGQKGFVRIRFSREGDALRCTVEDNGVGREEAARIQAQSHSIYKSHGTRLVKERTEILNKIEYDIAIETRDRPGGGTIVTITIKD